MTRAHKLNDTQLEAALKRLDALAQAAPDLAEPVAFYRALLPLLHEAQARVTPVRLDPDSMQRNLAAGLPVLIGEELLFDLDATRALFLKLCRLVETVGETAPRRSGTWSLFKRGQPDALKLIDEGRNGGSAALRTTAAAQIRRAVEKNELDIFAVFLALASGEWRRAELVALGLKLDSELLWMLAQNSLKPALRAWVDGLKDNLPLDRWQRGQCPFCGSLPALAEIQGKEGGRRLRCAMCGADWPYPRLQCAFCSNREYTSLGYISVPGEEDKYRVQTCDKCQSYLKVVITFDPTPIEQLAIEDLATLHLDLIAAERDFTRLRMQ